ncbi:hypothetical protein H696_02324 [Fonticula alba]|uniref:Uncharacterized protein n=1 Tax=Fonticula alba TaxID=691883 RepID=A0A058ZBS4_FONAL|nr:hypothetical protein H696_02324 [Fonticula alba]KCV71373.1 hypothetical protein H696_02324 [Fonticula alba]|eukprot:XP_009494496.1 hypothetical protein H696_02324 [Fonticula alba]
MRAGSRDSGPGRAGPATSSRPLSRSRAAREKPATARRTFRWPKMSTNRGRCRVSGPAEVEESRPGAWAPKCTGHRSPAGKTAVRPTGSSPHTSTRPERRTAKPNCAPAARSTTGSSDSSARGMHTGWASRSAPGVTGVPHWPYSLLPQAKTRPSAVRARVKSAPQTSRVGAGIPAGAAEVSHAPATCAGMLRAFSSPVDEANGPSWQSASHPEATIPEGEDPPAWPPEGDRMATTVWSSPADRAVTGWPTGARASWNPSRRPAWAPSWPKMLAPCRASTCSGVPVPVPETRWSRAAPCARPVARASTRQDSGRDVRLTSMSGRTRRSASGAGTRPSVSRLSWASRSISNPAPSCPWVFTPAPRRVSPVSGRRSVQRT